MKTVTTVSELNSVIDSYRKDGKTVGFVPTMGYLHDGHLSLVKTAKDKCDITVVSIYVNRSQFNQSSDFDSYPRDFQKDQDVLENIGCDLLFLPSEEEMDRVPLRYVYSAQGVDKELEGEYRSGHFKGVMEVVGRLLDVTQPTIAFFGEKDFQQYAVLKAFCDENEIPVNLALVPTKREYDGLAMSSRNVRLNADARKVAGKLYAEMMSVKAKAKNTDVSELLNSSRISLEKHGFTIDYFRVAKLKGDKRLFAAASLGGVRLIDNILIED